MIDPLTLVLAPLALAVGYVLGIRRGKQIAAHRIDEILSHSKGWR